jgi:glucosamine 6-phosphate synthetase-like amidotransferase/phosphosugar isomerase protein
VQNYIEDLTKIPQKIESIFGKIEVLEELSKHFFRSPNFLYLGRGIHYPVALEGALKLKEISYIHAEGYPSGEMKHGPNALIDETLPVVVIATSNINNPRSIQLYEKTLSNIKEVKARDGIVISVTPFNKEPSKPRTLHRSSSTNDFLLPSSRQFPCSCSPTTSPFAAVATWINPETWLSRSPLNRLGRQNSVIRHASI